MVRIETGFTDAERPRAAALYWQAFGRKLGVTMGPAKRGVAFFARVLDPGFAVVARDEEGRMIGLAGFKTHQGGLTGGGLRDLIGVYGVFGSLWRASLLSALDRPVEDDTLLMDGICVADEARGQGVGTRLLSAIKAEAAARGLRHVRLDVIDTNPRARALYEREGFVPTGEERAGVLRHVFGFARSTTMIFAAS